MPFPNAIVTSSLREETLEVSTDSKKEGACKTECGSTGLTSQKEALHLGSERCYLLGSWAWLNKVLQSLDGMTLRTNHLPRF